MKKNFGAQQEQFLNYHHTTLIPPTLKPHCTQRGCFRSFGCFSCFALPFWVYKYKEAQLLNYPLPQCRNLLLPHSPRANSDLFNFTSHPFLSCCLLVLGSHLAAPLLPWSHGVRTHSWSSPSSCKEQAELWTHHMSQPDTHWLGREAPHAPGRECSTCTACHRIHTCSCQFLGKKKDKNLCEKGKQPQEKPCWIRPKHLVQHPFTSSGQPDTPKGSPAGRQRPKPPTVFPLHPSNWYLEIHCLWSCRFHLPITAKRHWWV